MISSIIQALFFFKKFSPIWVSKKRNDKKIYALLNIESETKFLCLPQRKKKLQKKEFFYRKGKVGDWRKERKEGLLTSLRPLIKKHSTTLIGKRANELKVNEKTVRTAIKQDLSPDLKPLITL